MFLNHSFKLVAAFILLVAVVLSGCVTVAAKPITEAQPVAVAQTATQAELEAQVREAIFAWEDAYQAGDLERLMEIYAEDAVSMPPDRPIIKGKAAIEDDFRQFFEDFTVERQFSLVDLELAGDMAIRRGEWTQTFTPRPVVS